MKFPSGGFETSSCALLPTIDPSGRLLKRPLAEAANMPAIVRSGGAFPQGWRDPAAIRDQGQAMAKTLFIDSTPDIDRLWRRVHRPQDPEVAVNFGPIAEADIVARLGGYDTCIVD